MAPELKPPRASPPQVDYRLRQLRKLFARASDEHFLQLMWAIDALRSGNPQLAAAYLDFTPGAADQTVNSRLAIHEWETETLVIQLLLAVREELRQGTTFDCKKFGDAALLVNRLRALENDESALYLAGDFNVLAEMQRAAHRQFHWQRGYFNLPQMYRYAYLYAQGQCGQYFENQFGIPITELHFVGFAVFTQSRRTPWINRNITAPEVGLTVDLVRRALPLLLISVEKAREETRKLVEQMNQKHGKALPTAYLPSILRRFPLLALNDDADNFIAPISEAILIRVTSGLYYNLISGGQPLLNEASDRFEQYVADYIDALMERFTVRRAYRYEPKKGSPVDTPDVLVADGQRIVLAIECKATKLTYLAQFAEDPFEAEKKQYLQMANGIFQLWRFFSHVRRGLLTETVDADTAAMVVTLDPFRLIDPALKAKLMGEAHTLANADGEIIGEDRRATIIFCPIDELEDVVCRTDEDRFLASLKATRDKKYEGWGFFGVDRNASGKPTVEKKFPFALGGLLPWWDRIGD
jgi:hypothetical protein